MIRCCPTGKRLSEDEDFRPIEVTLDRQQGANAWLTIACEERTANRRAMQHIGLMANLPTILVLQLGNLKPGEVRSAP